MEPVDVDVAIIGAGTAGLNTWRGATEAGAKAVLIDPGPLGTTCARVGCMPSKLLIAAAEAAHRGAHASVFGVHFPTVEIDGVAVMTRLRKMRDLFVTRTKANIDRIDAKGVILHARAQVVDAHTLELSDGRRVHAKQIVLATGSRPWVPPAYRDLGERMLTNDGIFELERVPESLLVIGAGAIGLELGQSFRRLGARVTILDLGDNIAALDDEVVAGAAREIFKKELDLHLHHELRSIEAVDGGVRARFLDDEGVERDETYQYALVATGRRPALEGLGLDKAGLDPLPPVDPHTRRIGESNFFMAGDADGDRMLLHEAAHEGRIAGRNAIRFPDVEAGRRMTPIALVFTDPEIAVVGMRATELDEDVHIIGELDFRFQSRAKVLARDVGRMRVYADKSDGRLRGATVLGPDAEHLGHLLAWVIQLGLTASQVLELPFYHPVVEEGLQGVLRELAGKVVED